MLEKLHKKVELGEISPYLYQRVKSCIDSIPSNLQDELLEDATILSGIGIQSEDDYKNFFYITTHTKKIANEISKTLLTADQLAEISSIIYSSRTEFPIDSIYNFYKAADRALKIMNIPIKKVAYPLGYGNIHPDYPYNVPKWMIAMRELYAVVHRGMNYQDAFNKITNGWDTMEKEDFKAWQRFYQEGAHDKYKIAQNNQYFRANDGSPLIPMKDLRSKFPGIPDMNMFDLPIDVAEEKRKRQEEFQQKLDDKNNQIEEIKKKLISRLTSAERLITDRAARDDLNSTIEMGLAKWLETLHSLKRSIQTAPMSSSASPILNDLIIKKGNQISKEGYAMAGKLLISLAQEPKAPPVEELESSEELPPPQALPDMDESEDEAMKDFVRRMNHEHFEDESDLDDLELDEDELVVEAQALPEEENPAAMEDAFMGGQEPAIEVEDKGNEILENGDALDKALEGITIEDVIERLNLVANIIQNREIPRQLSFIDMMLGKLGLATYFPSLGEAIRSALESHQYMYTRIEDIQSKLRGSVQPAQQLELTTDETAEQATTDTLDSVRQNLAESEELERQRAEDRKAKREAREAAPPPQAVQQVAPEELAGPVEVESGPPTRAT